MLFYSIDASDLPTDFLVLLFSLEVPHLFTELFFSLVIYFLLALKDLNDPP